MVAVKTTHLASSKNDTIAIFVWKGESVEKSLPASLKATQSVRCGSDMFKGEEGEKRLLYTADSSLTKKIILIGLGSKKEFNIPKFRNCIGDICKYASNAKISSLSFLLGDNVTHGNVISGTDAAFVITEIVQLAAYSFQKHKTKDEKNKKHLKDITILAVRSQLLNALQQAVGRAVLIAQATNNARDLVNGPTNDITPQGFARYIVAEAKKLPVECQVLGLKEIKKEKMGGVLAVSQGSGNEPVFLILRYKGRGRKKKKVCLAGKGICFDSGGLCLKPPWNMSDMRYDMAGGAVCAQVVLLAARLKISHEVVALIPLCENSADGKAYRPGDIVKTLSGLTVEVINTDAEGRMIMCDALYYARKYNPDIVVSVGTLTGAAKICLGDKAAALLGNNERIMHALQKAGEAVGERLWRLPLWEDYQEDIKSDVADLKNMGKKGAGTIIAATFLSNFIPKTKWGHLDIAATAWEDEGKSFIAKGASGFGIRLLVRFLSSLN